MVQSFLGSFGKTSFLTENFLCVSPSIRIAQNVLAEMIAIST